MGVRGRVLEWAREHAAGAIVAEVRIGLGYTAVLLRDGRAGVAYTFARDVAGDCRCFSGPRPLAGRRAEELLSIPMGSRRCEAAIALATANAIGNTASTSHLEGDVLDHLRLDAGDEVAMIGHFAPLVPALRERAASLHIFEGIAEPHGELRPAHEAPDCLRRSQVALVTATALVNDTVDALLEAASGCHEVAILGATTPLIPAAFAGTSATLLSGVVIEESAGVLQAVSEAGGRRAFKPHVRKVDLRLTQTRSQAPFENG